MSNIPTPRRQFLKSLGAAASVGAGALAEQANQIEQWGVFELELKGPKSGSPYIEVDLSAEFRFQNRSVSVTGFYDGDGSYRIRFMPDMIGSWSYVTASKQPELAGRKGTFDCVAPSSGNHGPVQVSSIWHFAFADGTPYVPVGTTCYAWVHQGDELEEQTISTLRGAPFNKLRMCIFPKSYAFNQNEPLLYPFPRDASGTNDYTQFNPAFFRHIEKRIEQLSQLGIQADLILFHPYDRWGYAKMPSEVDDRYLRYLVARLAAYRNVWWSLANEYDFLKAKQMSDWDRFFRIVQQSDPYSHLRSIHHSKVMYDHSKPWVTHLSIQDDEFLKTAGYLKQYMKPVIYDECKYEGNIHQRWGNISAQEMVRRFWLGTVCGAYVGHGETYLDSKDILWWSKGGVLRGESPKRIAFLRRILEEGPVEGLNPISEYYLGAGQPGKFYLFYFDLHQPADYEFTLDKDAYYKADLIDPWEMTITPINGSFQGKFSLKLPGKPYLAIRFQAVS
jgi:uncharacterized protein DUF5060/uncharacterized protein DUF5605/uncharacterized protein DUF4038